MIVAIQKERTYAVFAKWADAVAEHQPTRFGFDGRATISDLDYFPRKLRSKQQLVFVPEMDIIGKAEIDAFVIVSREHRITTANLTWEHRHALVLRGGSIQSDKPEAKKI